MNWSKRIIFVIPLLTAIVSLSSLWLALMTGWFGPPQGVGLQFCEAERPGLIKQPVNTGSNISFVVAGLLMAASLAKGTYIGLRNPLAQKPLYGIVLSCIVVLLGPASMAMHASLTARGGFYDMLSMYLIVSFTAPYAIQRCFRLPPYGFVLLFAGVLSSCLWADFHGGFGFLFGHSGITAFAFYISLTVMFELLNMYVRKIRGEQRWGWLSLASLLLAFLIWNLSLEGRPFWYPHSLIQGHAFWHIFCAAAAYFLFIYYVRQNDTAGTPACVVAGLPAAQIPARTAALGVGPGKN
jgi:hypothetical protein